MNKIEWKTKKDGLTGCVLRYDFGRVSVAHQVKRDYWAVRLDKKIVSRHENSEKALRRGREVLANPRAWEGKKSA